MDQDSSNGAGPDKRNWRERLGIGAKELPKLSDEFRDEPQMSAPPPAGTAKPAPRAPVTKPAPMAPRVKPAQPAAEAPAAPSVPPALSRATPRAPDNAAQDALAEKLRAQRAAAERLAEQRVQAARNRAEGKKPEAPVPQRPAAPPLRPSSATPRTPSVPPPPGTRPKFSFADDSRAGGAAPLSPPRPALGGERAPPPFLRPSANGSLGARPQPAFRPSGEGGSGYVPPPRLQPPGLTRPALGTDAAGYGGSRLPVRRTPGIDPFVRAPEPREPVEEEFDEDGRAAPRLGRPGTSLRARDPSDDFDEVFEDDQAPRGRAVGRSLQTEYDGEDGFADEPRRSSGPWLLLAALLGAAVLVGALVWYYSDNVKNLAGVGSSSSSGTTPVVPAPEDPAKVAAPDANGDSQTEAPAARKKQIYDRIVGEQEVTGEMQPTEETPVAPEAAQPDAAAPAAAEAPAIDQVPKVEPAGNANTIPVPDAPTQGTSQGLPEVEPPPPLPIPGSDQQGNLGLKGGSQVAATSAQPDQGATAPPPPPSSSAQTSSIDANPPPPPEKATDGAALVSGGASSAGTPGASAATEPVVTPQPDTQVTPPAPVKPAQTDAAVEEPAPPPPPKKKAPAKKTTTKQTASKQTNNNLGSKPVVLVPPSQQGAAQDSSAAATQPLTTAPATEPPAAAAPTTQKRKTIFDLFNAGTGGAAATTQATPPAAPTQVASAATQTKQATAPATQPKAAPEPAPAATSSGYVVQLASFRSDTEAKKEYARLAGAYPSVVGPLKSSIRQTTVGGSTRYQLGLGPLPTRGDATRVCGELIAAGESDCIVRGP